MSKINIPKNVILLKCYCYQSLQDKTFVTFALDKHTAVFIKIYIFGIPLEKLPLVLKFFLRQKPFSVGKCFISQNYFDHRKGIQSHGHFYNFISKKISSWKVLFSNEILIQLH